MTNEFQNAEDLPELLDVNRPEDEAELLDGWPTDEAALLKRLREIAAELTEHRQ